MTPDLDRVVFARRRRAFSRTHPSEYVPIRSVHGGLRSASIWIGLRSEGNNEGGAGDHENDGGEVLS